MARLGLRATINAYNAQDTLGYKIGMRAFNNMSMEDLYDTTKNIVKYENKRIRSMLDKGYVTQAILSYGKKSGRLDMQTAEDIRRTEGREAYISYIRKSVTLYMGNREEYINATTPEIVSQYREDLLKKLNIAVRFAGMKTSTIAGEKRAERKTISTLKKDHGLDMKDWSREDREEFWDLLYGYASIGENLGTRFVLHSDEVIDDIGRIWGEGNYDTPQELLEEMRIRYDDLSEEGLRNASEFFDRPRTQTYDPAEEINRAAESGELYREVEFRNLDWE